ncbi:MAG: sulfatase [Nannocystaceae bacterium]|nr:sulfatase [Nannocystaceae bacterium]
MDPPNDAAPVGCGTAGCGGSVMWGRREFAGALMALLFGACGDDAAGGRLVAAPPSTPDAPRVVAPVARVETTDRWLDLIAQRPGAVVLRHERVIVELSRAAAARHIALGQNDRWDLGVLVDGREAGVLHGRTGALNIPVDGQRSPGLNPDTEENTGLAVAVTVRPTVEDQSMTVLWNERPLAHLKLTEGWQRRTLSLPAEHVHAGDNQLRLHFRRLAKDDEDSPGTSAAVQRIEVGAHAIITHPPEETGPPVSVQPRAGGETVVRLAGDSALAYYPTPPHRGRLVLGVRGRGAIAVRVSTDADHREARPGTTLLDEPLRPAGQDHELDLSAWGETPIRLEIAVRGSAGDSEASILAAMITARRTVPRDTRRRTPRDIVIIAIEGARADALLEPGRRPALERIEALVRESLVFERAYAVGAAAVPSHAAWLSSVVPPVHLTVRGTFVADGQVLLPETLARGGYYRAAVSANDYLNTERGLLQGFDITRVISAQAEDDDAAAVATMLRRLAAKRSERWFLLANVNDPQAPYEPPRELMSPLPPPAGAPVAHLTHVWVGRVHMGKHEPSADELAYIRRLYRGELQVVDGAIGELLDFLEREGRLEDAIVVVVGIHGEEFYEHGGAGHGRNLYDESIRVPLMIRAPKLLAPGRVTVPVDLLDLAPTLADLVGVAAPDGWQGESLLAVIDDPQTPPRLVVAYLGDGSRAAIVGHHKLVLGPGLGEQFYDLNADPAELVDLAPAGGAALRMVRTALAWQLAHEGRWKRARWGTGANLRSAFAMDLGM